MPVRANLTDEVLGITGRKYATPALLTARAGRRAHRIPPDPSTGRREVANGAPFPARHYPQKWGDFRISGRPL